MPKNSATIVSIKRKVQSFVRAQRRNPDRYRILAEGDSWFTTPVEGWKGPTLVDSLKRHTSGGKRPFNIVMIANPTTELRSTLDGNNIDVALASNPDWLGNQTYDLVLLSCGGNDILGTELRSMLHDPTLSTSVNRCINAAPTLEKAARCVLKCEHFCGLLKIMEKRLLHFRRDVLRPDGLGRARILIHGYDYSIPDGRGMKILGGLIRVGPWLQPVFREHHIPPRLHKPLLKILIDEFNRMLRRVAISQRLLHYVDLRGTLSATADWSDEIHPHTGTGIPKLSQRQQTAIKAIRDGDAGSIIEFDAVSEEYTCGCR